MIVVKRKQMMVVSVAVLVAVAGYLNWSYDRRQPEAEPASAEALGEVQLVENETDFFTEARMERDASRSRAVASMQTMAEDGSVTPESKTAAETEIINMTKVAETENTIENMVRAKGFADAVIYITEGKVTAIVKTDGLGAEDVAKIVDIVTSQTGIPAADIKIVEAK